MNSAFRGTRGGGGDMVFGFQGVLQECVRVPGGRRAPREGRGLGRRPGEKKNSSKDSHLRKKKE